MNFLRRFFRLFRRPRLHSPSIAAMSVKILKRFAKANPKHRAALNVVAGILIDLIEDNNELRLEIKMAREAKVIAALLRQVDALTMENNALKAAVPPASAVKDADDIATEQSAAVTLKLDANGDPIAVPA